MSCKYSDNEGKCELWDGTIEMPVDKRGICRVEEDEEPDCEDFEER